MILAEESTEQDSLELGILMALAYSFFVAELREELAAAGFKRLNHSFGYVIRAVAESPLTLRELADRLEMTSPGAIKIVDDMTKHGYLERKTHPDDARAKRIALTRKGRAALAAARAFHRRFEQNLSRRIGKRAAAAFRSALESIVTRKELEGIPARLRPV